ncbi:MAG: hypothetical protein V4481_02310 [Patescibacteria group bacterium]
MLSIAKFFERIQNKRSKDVFIRTVVQSAIQKNTGAVVPLEFVTFKGEAVALKNVSSTLLSAIFIKKNQILKDINGEQAIRIVQDIR